MQSSGINVECANGVVTLSGEVASMWEKNSVSKAAGRMSGVSAVINNTVVMSPSSGPDDRKITRMVERALAAASSVPDSVRVETTGARVRLTGAAQWDYQRRAAERAVQQLHGIREVVNEISLLQRPTAVDAEQRITAALQRDALLYREPVRVRVSGSTATLTGAVHSWAERSRAEYVAWSSPHIGIVENELTVIADDEEPQEAQVHRSH